jgi:hypothetical protein
MMKYYVRSGELERVVIADTPQEACEKAIDTCKGETIDAYFFYVSELGFRGPSPDNETVDSEFMPEWSIQTDDVLETSGFDMEDDE